jgi:Uma2 family endonuclease
MSRTTEQPIMPDLPSFAGGLLTEERVAAVRAELRETDGEPLETPWHRSNINLLIDAVVWQRRSQTNFYVGGNMFLYYSLTQARNWEYKGPDFFFVKDVDGTRPRRYWWVFEEGKYPNFILELLSPSTALADRTTKKDLYEQRFRTPEYFYFDPQTRELSGWGLTKGRYEPLRPNERGWLWSEELGLWVGTWEGTFQKIMGTWVRFFDTDGILVPTETEAQRQRADNEKHRADEEKHRADDLAAELARVQALLKEKEISPDQPK